MLRRPFSHKLKYKLAIQNANAILQVSVLPSFFIQSTNTTSFKIRFSSFNFDYYIKYDCRVIYLAVELYDKCCI